MLAVTVVAEWVGFVGFALLTVGFGERGDGQWVDDGGGCRGALEVARHVRKGGGA